MKTTRSRYRGEGMSCEPARVHVGLRTAVSAPRVSQEKRYSASHIPVIAVYRGFGYMANGAVWGPRGGL